MNVYKNDAVRYKTEMKERIDIAAYAGMFVIFVNFISKLILKKFFPAVSGTDYMLFLAADTCISMLPFLIFYRIRCGKISDLVKTPKKQLCSNSATIFAVIFGFGSCTAANFLISVIAAYIFKFETGTVINGYVTDIPSILIAAATVGIVPAVCEELLFRGCIIGSLKKYNVFMSVVISAVIFSLVHSGINGMIFAFLCGMILGAVRIYTGRFFAAVTVHFMNNILAVILAAVKILTGGDIGNIIFYVFGAVGIILTVICVILFRMGKIKTDHIFSEEDLPYAQSAESVAGSSAMILVLLLFAVIVEM